MWGTARWHGDLVMECRQRRCQRRCQEANVGASGDASCAWQDVCASTGSANDSAEAGVGGRFGSHAASHSTAATCESAVVVDEQESWQVNVSLTGVHKKYADWTGE